MNAAPPPWLRSRAERTLAREARVYWWWECQLCGAVGIVNSDRDAAMRGYEAHFRKHRVEG